MAVPNFTAWMKVKESTAFTRAREAAAGLRVGKGPSIPDAAINSHSTANPAIAKAIEKRNKKEKKHGCDSKMPPK
jgi:hypothetical protein